MIGQPFSWLRWSSSLCGRHSGRCFVFSDIWQLFINTSTTIITFLVVFLIQNTQNRDAKAAHLKLDELIRSHVPAHNEIIDIESAGKIAATRRRKRHHTFIDIDLAFVASCKHLATNK